MGTKLDRSVSWSDAKLADVGSGKVISPNPGELVRAGGAAGTAITIPGWNDDEDGGVNYTALTDGVQVRHLGGVSQSLGVSVAGNKITVQLETDGDGVPLSTAEEVEDEVDGSAAALVTTAVTGDGSGVAGLATGWVNLSDGATGSIRRALDQVSQMLWFLADHARAARPRSFRSDGTNIIIKGLRGLGILDEDSISHAPDGGSTWNAVYCYDNAGAIGFYWGSQAHGLDEYQEGKAGDPAKRYLGSYRREGSSYTPLTGNASGRYFYDQPLLVLEDEDTEGAWTDCNLQDFVPPTAAFVICAVQLDNGKATPNTVAFRAKGTTITESDARKVLANATSSAQGAFEMAMDADRFLQFFLNDNASTSTFDLYVLGWQEK